MAEEENKQPIEPTEPDAKKTIQEADNGDKGSEKVKDSITLSKEELSDMIKKRVSNAVKEKEDAQKEAKRLASLSDDDRAKEEIENAKKETKALQGQIEALKSEQARYNLTKEATKQLSSKGIDASDEVLNMLVASDAETTKNNIEAYSKAIADNTEKAKNELLKGKAPKTATVSGGGKLTIEDRINNRLKQK